MMKYDPKGMSAFQISIEGDLEADGRSEAARPVYRSQNQINYSIISLSTTISPTPKSDSRRRFSTTHSTSSHQTRLCILCICIQDKDKGGKGECYAGQAIQTLQMDDVTLSTS